MVFNFNKCLTAALLAVALLSVAYIFETHKTNSYADTTTYMGGDIVSYNMCLISDTPLTLSFPIITKDTISSIELLSIGKSASSHILTSLTFDQTDFITYNDYNIYNFSISFRNKSTYAKGYSIDIPKINLKINNKKQTYNTPDLSFCSDTYISNNNEYCVNSNDLIVSDTNTAYYTIPTTENLASLTLKTNSNVELINFKTTGFFNISDFSINNTPADSNNLYLKLKKNNTFYTKYALNYTDYKYSSKIVKSSLIVTYKVGDKYCVYVTNAPLYVFPGYSKNFAMERYIDNL